MVGEHAGAEDPQGSPSPPCQSQTWIHHPSTMERVGRASWCGGPRAAGLRGSRGPFVRAIGLEVAALHPGTFPEAAPGLRSGTPRLPKVTAGVLCAPRRSRSRGFCAEAAGTPAALCRVVEHGGDLSLPELPVRGFSLSSGSWQVLLLSLGIPNHRGFLLVVPVCATAAPPALAWSLLKQKRRFPNRIKLASLLRRDKQQAALLYFKT